jgi:hypothetical protein
MEWYKWVFDGVGGAVLVAVGAWLFRRLRHSPPVRPTVSGSLVDSPVTANITAPLDQAQVAVGNNINQNVEHHHHYAASEIKKTKTTEPTPKQILEEIDSALPIDQDNAKKKYIGLNVLWQTSLLAISEFKDRWIVVTRFPDRGYEFRSVCFSMSSVPSELSSATKYSTLLIKGVIRSVEGHTSGIELETDPEVYVIKRA